MHKIYMVFDGRYRRDPDNALCLSVPGSTDKGMTLEAAVKEAKEEFGDCDCVLVEADWDPDRRIADEGEIVWDSYET